MKYDNYLADFQALIDGAKSEHEIELMRKALIEARGYLERKAYAVLQSAFKIKMGGR